MTDQEIICTFMEPNPRKKPNRSRDSVGGWWRLPLTNEWIPLAWEIDLDALREVEARLSQEQAEQYDKLLNGSYDYERLNYVWHADTEQRIKALAAVLRPVVEGEVTRG